MNNTYKLSFFDDRFIAEYANFEFAMIAAKQLSRLMIGEIIVLRSMFFTYTYVNGVEQ